MNHGKRGGKKLKNKNSNGGAMNNSMVGGGEGYNRY